MLDVINRHKGLSIVLGLSFVLFIIMLIIFVSLFFGNGNGKYGNRLEGIEDVKLSDSFLNEVEESLKNDERVIDSTVRLQGKIVYINFEVNSDVSVDVAKEIAGSTLEKFSDEEKEFYDFSYIIKWIIISEEESSIKAISGTKHPLKESITWSKS